MPHELVAGQQAVYKELSIALFLNSYLAVMETIKLALKPITVKHLKELMADAEVYGWALVRAYDLI